MKPSRESEFEEILAGFVLGDLSEEELQQLNQLSNSTSAEVAKELERVAALATLAGADQQEALPEALHTAITATGRALVSADQATSKANVVPASKYRAGQLREAVAWLACLAATVLALFAWQSSSLNTAALVNARAARQSLMASAADLIQTDWADGKTPLPAKVTGDVVWSTAAQRGFMRLVNLPVNDPNVEQYQLWIIDPSRDDEPVDGGVFNISSLGESIVPIHAKLAVGQPKAFAITIEKPGGVVVSTQERLPLLAQVQ